MNDNRAQVAPAVPVDFEFIRRQANFMAYELDNCIDIIHIKVEEVQFGTILGYGQEMRDNLTCICRCSRTTAAAIADNIRQHQNGQVHCRDNLELRANWWTLLHMIAILRMKIGAPSETTKPAWLWHLCHGDAIKIAHINNQIIQLVEIGNSFLVSLKNERHDAADPGAEELEADVEYGISDFGMLRAPSCPILPVPFEMEREVPVEVGPALPIDQLVHPDPAFLAPVVPEPAGTRQDTPFPFDREILNIPQRPMYRHVPRNLVDRLSEPLELHRELMLGPDHNVDDDDLRHARDSLTPLNEVTPELEEELADIEAHNRVREWFRQESPEPELHRAYELAEPRGGSPAPQIVDDYMPLEYFRLLAAYAAYEYAGRGYNRENDDVDMDDEHPRYYVPEPVYQPEPRYGVMAVPDEGLLDDAYDYPLW